MTAMPSDTDEIFLTDGGLETTLIFLEGFDLPCFASFDLLKGAEGTEALRNYYKRYLRIAKENKLGFILESPTWRANPDWVERVGYPRSETAAINRKAGQMMVDLKEEFAGQTGHIVVSGCLGPRGDGYQADATMSPEAAREYHSEQIAALKSVPVDIVTAITMTNVEEAIGITQAAADAGIPAVISFTLETNGRLPSGMSLKDAITTVDGACAVQPIYYMINCAHPVHFADELIAAKDELWTRRIRGLRANASVKSHAELDESTELDRGDLNDFGTGHASLVSYFPQLNVFGGCCGTDEDHILTIVDQLKLSKS